jgi:hypothetical protein
VWRFRAAAGRFGQGINRLGDEGSACCFDGELGARGDSELCEDVGEVHFYGATGDEHPFADLRICEPLSDEPSVSDHLRCTITGIAAAGPAARRSGQIAIGGSMLLANDDMLTLSDTAPATPINGGTGIYRHAHGSLIPKNFGNNTDFTIKVTY